MVSSQNCQVTLWKLFASSWLHIIISTIFSIVTTVTGGEADQTGLQKESYQFEKHGNVEAGLITNPTNVSILGGIKIYQLLNILWNTIIFAYTCVCFFMMKKISFIDRNKNTISALLEKINNDNI